MTWGGAYGPPRREAERQGGASSVSAGERAGRRGGGSRVGVMGAWTRMRRREEKRKEKKRKEREKKK